MKNLAKLRRSQTWWSTRNVWLLALAVLCGSVVICPADVAMLAVSAPAAAGTNSYLPPGQPDAALLLAPPPLPGSPEQAADMAEVVAVHAACTTKEATVADAEKKFSVFTFAPAIGADFQPGKFPKTEAFIERVKTAAAAATDNAKNHFKRPRPFVVNPGLATGKLEKSFSYPSGHSTEGTVLALVLAELFPDKKEAILAEGRAIGWHRVLLGRHYPTDIHAGRTFAQAIVQEMKNNPDFQRDFALAQREIAQATK